MSDDDENEEGGSESEEEDKVGGQSLSPSRTLALYHSFSRAGFLVLALFRTVGLAQSCTLSLLLKLTFSSLSLSLARSSFHKVFEYKIKDLSPV